MKTIQTSHRQLVFFPLFLLLLLVPFTAPAEESPENTASRLQKHYDSIFSLSFDFVQSTRGQLAGRPKTGRGQAFFVKGVKHTDTATPPGKMRWNYSTPEEQVLVSDGQQFSMYFSSLNQMIVTPAQSLQQDLTYSFFTGAGNLLMDFEVFPPDQGSNLTTGEQEQTRVIKLIPKEQQSQVTSIHLWITADSLIRRIEILDHFDTLTVLNFSNIKVNTLSPEDAPLMKRLFTFTPPEDTEIIYQ